MKEQAELSRLMDDVNETAQRIKMRLTKLGETIKEKAAGDSDANSRIKRTLHASAQKKVTACSPPPPPPAHGSTLDLKRV